MTSWDSETLNMTSWDSETHFSFPIFISMMHNDVTTLELSWENLAISHFEIW
jgi:hypothetical protein